VRDGHKSLHSFKPSDLLRRSSSAHLLKSRLSPVLVYSSALVAYSLSASTIIYVTLGFVQLILSLSSSSLPSPIPPPSYTLHALVYVLLHLLPFMRHLPHYFICSTAVVIFHPPSSRLYAVYVYRGDSSPVDSRDTSTTNGVENTLFALCTSQLGRTLQHPFLPATGNGWILFAYRQQRS